MPTLVMDFSANQTIREGIQPSPLQRIPQVKQKAKPKTGRLDHSRRKWTRQLQAIRQKYNSGQNTTVIRVGSGSVVLMSGHDERARKLRLRFLERVREARIEYKLSDYDYELLCDITHMPIREWDKEFERELKQRLEFRELPNPGNPSIEILDIMIARYENRKM